MVFFQNMYLEDFLNTFLKFTQGFVTIVPMKEFFQGESYLLASVHHYTVAKHLYVCLSYSPNT